MDFYFELLSNIYPIVSICLLLRSVFLIHVAFMPLARGISSISSLSSSAVVNQLVISLLACFLSFFLHRSSSTINQFDSDDPSIKQLTSLNSTHASISRPSFCFSCIIINISQYHCTRVTVVAVTVTSLFVYFRHVHRHSWLEARLCRLSAPYLHCIISLSQFSIVISLPSSRFLYLITAVINQSVSHHCFRWWRYRH